MIFMSKHASASGTAALTGKNSQMSSRCLIYNTKWLESWLLRMITEMHCTMLHLPCGCTFFNWLFSEILTRQLTARSAKRNDCSAPTSARYSILCRWWLQSCLHWNYCRTMCNIVHLPSPKILKTSARYRMAKTHRMPYLYRSFSAKGLHNRLILTADSAYSADFAY